MIEWSQKVKKEAAPVSGIDAYVFLIAVIAAGVVVHAAIAWALLYQGAP